MQTKTAQLQLIVNQTSLPEKKKTGDSSNAYVTLVINWHLLKILPDYILNYTRAYKSGLSGLVTVVIFRCGYLS